MKHAQQLRSVRHKHHVRCRFRTRFPFDRFIVQLLRALIHGSVRVIVNRHEQTKVRVHATVVQRVITRRVQQILHPGKLGEKLWHKLEITVPDRVQQIETHQVHVKHRHRRAVAHPRP